MSLLILGINGYLGKRFSQLTSETNVIGYGRKKNTDAVCTSYESRDFKNDDSIKDILIKYDVDKIVHFISSDVPSTPNTEIDGIYENILPTIKLLDAVRDINPDIRIVFISSGGTVYGNNYEKNHETDTLSPISRYGLHKKITEEYIDYYNRNYGMNIIIARVSNPYGTYVGLNKITGIIQTLIDRIDSGSELTLFGDTIRDYIYIDDVESAIEELIYYNGKEKIFNIGTGIGTKLSDLIRMVEDISNQKFNKIVYKDIRQTDVETNILDNGRMIDETNWKPTMPLKEGLEKTYRAMALK